MIIWGFKVYTTILASLVYVCDRCGNNAAHQLMKRVRKFSLFFVPLFPVGTKYYDTCVACGRTLEVAGQDAEAALARPASQPAPGFGQPPAFGQSAGTRPGAPQPGGPQPHNGQPTGPQAGFGQGVPGQVGFGRSNDGR